MLVTIFSLRLKRQRNLQTQQRSGKGNGTEQNVFQSTMPSSQQGGLANGLLTHSVCLFELLTYADICAFDC